MQGCPTSLRRGIGALWSDGVDNSDLFGRQAGRSHGEPASMDSARPSVEGRLLAGETVKNLFFLEKRNSGNFVCMTFSGRVGSTFGPVFFPHNPPLSSERVETY